MEQQQMNGEEQSATETEEPADSEETNSIRLRRFRQVVLSKPVDWSLKSGAWRNRQRQMNATHKISEMQRRINLAIIRKHRICSWLQREYKDYDKAQNWDERVTGRISRLLPVGRGRSHIWGWCNATMMLTTLAMAEVALTGNEAELAAPQNFHAGRLPYVRHRNDGCLVTEGRSLWCLPAWSSISRQITKQHFRVSKQIR